jgi:quercetin dioxygenase-like cupin family protein
MTMRHAARVLASCALAVAVLAPGTLFAEPRAEGPKAVALTPAALEWQPVPLVAGMMFARVWGEADAAQARFVKMPASARLPLHRHTATVRVVVVSGTYVYGTEGEPEKRYEAGSFIVTPGGTPHVAGCAEACLYYEEVNGRPDYLPVTDAR